MKTIVRPDTRVQRVASAYVESEYRARHTDGKEKEKWQRRSKRFYQWLAEKLV
jgi:hypothetical protein